LAKVSGKIQYSSQGVNDVAEGRELINPVRRGKLGIPVNSGPHLFNPSNFAQEVKGKFRIICESARMVGDSALFFIGKFAIEEVGVTEYASESVPVFADIPQFSADEGN